MNPHLSSGVFNQVWWPGNGGPPYDRGPHAGVAIPLTVNVEDRIDKSGGRVYIGNRGYMAHRYVYEQHRGPIPAGMSLDHLCRNRLCVNPDHLEPVDARTNTMRSPIAPAAVNARKTVCKRGHPLTDENVRVTSQGSRQCKACEPITHRARRAA